MSVCWAHVSALKRMKIKTFSNQIGISGLPETWNTPDELWSQIMIYFFFFFLLSVSCDFVFLWNSRNVLWTSKLHLTVHQCEGQEIMSLWVVCNESNLKFLHQWPVKLQPIKLHLWGVSASWESASLNESFTSSPLIHEQKQLIFIKSS